VGLRDRLSHAWNAFTGSGDEEKVYTSEYGGAFGMGYRQDRRSSRISNERSIVSSIYNRIGIDVAAIGMRHVRLDDQKRYKEDIDSALNNCLTVEANIDQAARAFRQDIAQTLFEQGVCAIVPVNTDLNPTTNSFDIKTMRVGEIMMWYPKHVRVRLYDGDREEASGVRREITLPKSMVAIVENPLYTVMNEPSSTLQRLIRKLSLLDSIDEQSGSGKLDIIIQLPYTIRSDTKRQQAEQRRKDIEFQLKGSQYGIAYADATEKIVQLNRPAENNLMAQVEYLVTMLYGQLGITPEVMNGTAGRIAQRRGAFGKSDSR